MSLGWRELDRSVWRGGVIFLSLALCWIVISTGWAKNIGTQSLLDLRTLLQAKLFLVALAFTGRWLIFPQYRAKGSRAMILASCLITNLLVNGGSWGWMIGNWRGGFWFLADLFFWSLLLTAIIEFVLGLYRFWLLILPTTPEGICSLWESLGTDLIKLGVYLCLFLGWLYYYLVSFYIIDTIIYSYSFLAFLLTGALTLYSIVHQKINQWLTKELSHLDHELAGLLDWQSYENHALGLLLPRYQFLLLTRDYLTRFGKAVLSWQICWIYACFGVFLLSLPYIFGLAVQVGSFK